MPNKQLQFMNAATAAAFLGVDRQVFDRWVHGNDGPPRRLIGKRYYYQREYLTEWLQAPRSKPLNAAPVRSLKPGQPPTVYVKHIAA